jgi:hypothetical protein
MTLLEAAILVLAISVGLLVLFGIGSLVGKAIAGGSDETPLFQARELERQRLSGLTEIQRVKVNNVLFMKGKR